MTKEKYFFENEIYSKNYKFKLKKDMELLADVKFINPPARSLDLGCGDNGNLFELVKMKYDVTGIDVSKTLIKNLKNYAKSKNLKIKLICSDIEKYNFNKKYDVIIMTGILHFISKSGIKRFLRKIKSHTAKNGINIIWAFREGDISQDDTSEGHYFKKKELFEIYKDWKLKSYSEGIEKTHTGDHKVVELLAIKK